MFALIETKGATHIAISIPNDGAAVSLPALARMLEENAVFINKSWREFSVVTPSMSIQLGDTYRMEDSESAELVIEQSTSVLDDSFVNFTPEVKASNKVAMEKKEAEITKLRRDLEVMKDMRNELQARLDSLNEVEA